MHHLKYWTDIHFYHSGDEFYSRLIEEIRAAKSSITIESYIFAYDQLTEMVLVELAAAVKRGCSVRLLIDGFGSYFWQSKIKAECLKLGIHLRIFHPLPQRIPFNYAIRWFFIMPLLKILKRLNRRNHRKITVIDNRIAFLGSMNFTQVHLESVMGHSCWRDSGVRLLGPPVQHLSQAFFESWLRAKYFRWTRLQWKYLKDRTYNTFHSLVRLNTSPRMRWRLYRDLLRRVRQSQNHILITTAYFLPRPRLARSLIKAARRGVRVEVIVPGISDVPIVRWAAYDLIHRMRIAGVQIYEFQNRVLHAKYMIIDQWASLGSLNINHRSMLHDYEVEAVFNDAESVGHLIQQWQKDQHDSLIIVEERYRATSWLKRLMSRILFLLRYWL